MNLPTKITVSRIVMIVTMLVGLFVLSLINGLVVPDLGDSKINIVYFVCFVIFVIAAYTDHLDGMLARKLNLVTDLGKFLDPIADKMLVNGMLIFLLVPQAYALNQRHDSLALAILMFCVIVMIVRDLIVDALRLIAVQKNIVIAANIFGKLKTVFQMVAIPAMLLNDWPFHLIYGDAIPEFLNVSNIMIYIATLMSLASGIIYVYQNRNVLKEVKK